MGGQNMGGGPVYFNPRLPNTKYSPEKRSNLRVVNTSECQKRVNKIIRDINEDMVYGNFEINPGKTVIFKKPPEIH